MRSTTYLDAHDAPPPRNVTLDPVGFDETIVATLPRRGGSRLEVIVRRRRDDGSVRVALRHYAKSGRDVTLEAFGFELDALLAGLTEAREVLRAVASTPIGGRP